MGRHISNRKFKHAFEIAQLFSLPSRRPAPTHQMMHRRQACVVGSNSSSTAPTGLIPFFISQSHTHTHTPFPHRGTPRPHFSPRRPMCVGLAAARGTFLGLLRSAAGNTSVLRRPLSPQSSSLAGLGDPRPDRHRGTPACGRRPAQPNQSNRPTLTHTPNPHPSTHTRIRQGL